jgi:hypothetical protein
MIIKSLFIRTKNIERKLQESEEIGRRKERIKCEKEMQIERTDISYRYEKIINKKDNIIKDLRKQHQKDKLAYDIYKEDAHIIKKEYEEFRDLVKLIFSPVIESVQKVNEKYDLTENLNRRLEKRNEKISKLLN